MLVKAGSFIKIYTGEFIIKGKIYKPQEERNETI